MRSLSEEFRRAIMSPNSGEVVLKLVTIEHADFAAPIRMVNNNGAIIHAGETYEPHGLALTLPDDRADEISNAILAVGSSDQMITQAVSEINSELLITVILIIASLNNVAQLTPEPFKSREWLVGPRSVEFTCSYSFPFDESAPADNFTPDKFPALHRT